MTILGKLHEISFYSIISAIICLCTGKTTLPALLDAALHVVSFSTFFLSFLFWGCVLSVPIAIISAFANKYRDGGEGLSFKSDLLLVIAFAHIAEEILGLLLTPFWFLRDIFRKTLTGADKIADYITYAIELIFFAVGMITL